jgi:hypothetical protein
MEMIRRDRCDGVVGIDLCVGASLHTYNSTSFELENLRKILNKTKLIER